ncbi:MAG: hypothetical protein NDP13_02260 [Crenarchaeota archaeon]|nr:hypothetical protein [Thermoproteota archaeon]MCR8453797.1 hypothetical protein [Thermoproteota archaeon]MCR8462871.1 hypothetical protein [Thermoproteota archaeon]MCR8470981.1 hypothetical protein [Thermoproteota archaeon]MCR8471800.1 hypothetical protein [Thermoproteota archaeon]
MEVPNVSNFLSFVLNHLLSLQRKSRLAQPSTDPLDGAWILTSDNRADDLQTGSPIVLDDDLYFGIIYPTARALEALAGIKGIGMTVLLRGLNFLLRVISKVDIESLKVEFLVPIMDAAWAAFNKLSYENVQNLLLPLVSNLRDISLKIDQDMESIYTYDIIARSKALLREGLNEHDINKISENFESMVLKRILVAARWLILHNFDVPTRIQELILDLLAKNFSGVFDIHKNPIMAYFISNSEVFATIIQELSNKKFAQIVLDRTIEFVSDLVLQEILNVAEACKLLTVTNILMQARAVIRR